MKKFIFYFNFLCCLLCAGQTLGQFNVKVGYNAQYSLFKETNTLFKNYNNQTPNLSKPYGQFHFMHGLELGGRFMMTNRVGLDAGFTSLFTTDNASARNFSGSIVNDEWRISQRVISLGLENYYNVFGFGIQLSHVNTNYLRDFPGAKSKLSVYSEGYYNARFCLIIQAKTRKNAFALKPYYNYPLSTIDLSAVDTSLNGSSGPPIPERLSSYGVSVVFYNGRQR